MKRALIVGCHGQDGRLLLEQLKAKDYAVLGIGRSSCVTHGDLAKEIFCEHALDVVNILDQSKVLDVFRIFKPDEVYYLAAFHHSADTRLAQTIDIFTRSYDVHVRGLLCFLEAMLAQRPESRLFYAASSHTFGTVESERITESTPLNPICVYGITKAAGVQCCRLYRKQHGVFASAGFLFNHESIYRRSDFLSQKIVRAAVAIKRGLESELKLGDLSAVVDWGFAGDYTRAMQKILSIEEPNDFIIASGIPRTVRDFAEASFKAVGLDYRKYVHETPMPGLRRRAPLIGDAAFLQSSTGWEPSVSFHRMIGEMVRHEANRYGLVLSLAN